ncbi:MAG: hypothetical protein JW832_10715 [Deltaproteobacteria bacterium]|nr:hypothetical protein [Deltaproteobacteria bacterium]
MKKVAYYTAGICLWLAASFSAAEAQEAVSREEINALKKEMQEMKALVGELKTVIKQQQGIITDLKKDVHENEKAATADDGHGRKEKAKDEGHDLEEILGNIKPRISATGDFVANLGDDKHMPHDYDRFDLRGVDITFIGEIDDAARAVFNLAYHEDDVSLEEGYLDVWKILPFKTDLRLGRFRTNFGLLNTIHPHALMQVDYPAIYRVYLGHEGYIDEGVGISGEAPSLWSNPFKWSLQVLNGERHEHGDDGEHEDEDEKEYKRLKDFNDTVYVGRLAHKFQPAEKLSVDWGLSGLTGRFHDDKTSPRYYLEGIDLTFNWHPFAEEYKRIRWQSEAFFSQTNGRDDNEHAYGYYSFLDYRFAPKWSAGTRYDYAQLPLESGDHLREYSAYLTHLYSPNNRVRLQLKNSQRNYGKEANEIMLEWTFTLGKHAHIKDEEH